jgi:hypothetical protein
VIDQALRKPVYERADGRCEYCRIPQSTYPITFPIDHIIARQHVGSDSAGNLALCCPRCNRKKGPNIAAVDPATGAISPLFHPRRDEWSAHFRWNGAAIVGTTAQGRATVALLDFNDIERLRLRQSLIDEGLQL